MEKCNTETMKSTSKAHQKHIKTWTLCDCNEHWTIECPSETTEESWDWPKSIHFIDWLNFWDFLQLQVLVIAFWAAKSLNFSEILGFDVVIFMWVMYF